MRRRIIDSATSAFAERGFFGASMREIAGRMDISEGRLYRYFPTKADLLDAIAVEAIARTESVLDALRSMARDEPDVRRFMLQYAKLYVAHVDAHHAWWALWLQHPPISEGRQQRLNQVTAEVCDFIAGLLAERTAARDPQVSASAFSGALFTLGMFRNRLGVGDLSEDVLTRLIETSLPPISS